MNGRNPVRARRERLGLSQQELAARAGVAIRTVQHIESSLDVRLSTLQAIAQALGTTTDALLYAPIRRTA